MFNAFANSWSMIKSSARVLKEDRELLIFPIISAIGIVLLTAVFFVPMLLIGYFGRVTEQGLQIVDYLILFVYYLIQYFAIFFCNTALVGAAMIRIRGGDPTVKDGLRIAYDRFESIFFYSLIAATIGMLLSLVKERGNSATRVVSSLFGFVWNVATFLVVPVLAIEDVGPIEAIKRSVAHLKKTWGEQLVGSFSIGAVFQLAAVLIVFAAGIFIVLLVNANALPWAYVAVGAVTLLILLAIALVNTTLKGIYTAAVYQYASTGDAGTYFDAEAVQNAFRSTSQPKI